MKQAEAESEGRLVQVTVGKSFNLVMTVVSPFDNLNEFVDLIFCVFMRVCQIPDCCEG